MSTIFGTTATETLNGTAGDDTIYGGPTIDPNATNTGRDTINAGSGNDIVYGQDGDDYLYGQDGGDTLYGGTGYDALYGGAGNDVLDGGADGDYLTGGNTMSESTVEIGTGDDRLNGGAGNDTLLGHDGNDVLNGGDGNDRLVGHTGFNVLNGEAGDDTLISAGVNDMLDGGTFGESATLGDLAILDRSTATSALSLALDSQVGNAQQNLGDGTLITNIERLDFTGGAGDDVVSGLTAGDYSDVLRGGAGADTLSGGGGIDQLYGGTGNDMLDGGAGRDNLYGGDTQSSTETNTGDDVMRGGDGDDWLYGQDGNDQLYGDAGYDALIGGAGNDTLYGGDGGDTLSGGFSTSESNAETGTGNDTLNGGAGNDTLLGFDGDDNLNGGDNDDRLVGHGGTNRLFGDAGDDTLVSAGVNDAVDGGNLGESAGDLAILNRGATAIGLTIALDTQQAGVQQNIGDGTLVTNIERLDFTGGSGNDVVSGLSSGQYSDTLRGGGGNDTLFGGGWVDQLYGGTGDDTLDGGTGNDNLYGGDTQTAAETGTGDDVMHGGDGNDWLYGQDGNDQLFGDAGADALLGGAGNDVIDGGADGDTVSGGNSTSESAAETGTGDDTLNGGAGNDTLLGFDGNDTLNGGDGDDRLIGHTGTNALNGDAGDDRLISTGINDLVDGGSGGESLGDVAVLDRSTANSGLSLALDLQMNGVQQNLGDGTRVTNVERLDFTGGSGNDVVSGLTSGNYADTLRGGAGDDTLNGGGGTNTLIGGAGNDTLLGAPGSATTIVYDSVRADYQIDFLASGQLQIIDLRTGSPNGTDIANGVSAIQFTDTTLQLAPSGSDGSISVNEDSTRALAVADFGFTDPNPADAMSAVRIDTVPNAGSFTLSGVAVNAGQVVSAAAISAGQLVFTPAANAYGNAYTSFTFSVIDQGGTYDPSPNRLTISVTPVNDAPVITSNGGGASASVDVTENSTAVTTVTASDVDSTSLVYSIGGGADAARFSINASTGALSFVSAPNFEAPADTGTDNVYDVVVKASDGVLSDTQAIAVTVTNVNEAPVITSNGGGASATTSVAENTTAVTTVTATDPDAGPTLTYAIVGGADAAKFAINSSTGALGFITAPDFEAPTDAGQNNVYDVTVQVSDGALTDTQALAVSVTNAVDNQAPVITSNGGGSAATISLAENTAVATTVTASDADVPAQTLTYSIIGGADAAQFGIDANTGALQFVTAPDAEAPSDAGANNVYDVLVQVADGNGGIDSQAIAVTVTDVDEFDVGPVTDGDATANAVAENAPNGTAVGLTARATDADATNDTITFSLADDAGGRFAIDDSTGVVTVANGALLDYETATSHDIIVRAASTDGSIATQSFSIAVTNVSAGGVGPVSDADGGVNSVSENAANGTLVGITATATDPDAADTVTFSLSDSAGGRFAIDATTGVVTVGNGALLDREAAASHDITVRATSSDGSSSTKLFTIALADVDEFDVGAIADTSVDPDRVNENAADGTVVGITAFAADADATVNGITYSLSDSAGGRFAIDAASGVVTVANGALLDFETAASHTITVAATSADGSTSKKSFAIELVDLSESGVGAVSDADAAANAVAENAAAGTAVGITAMAIDPDAADTVSFSLIDSAGGRFAIDAASGIVTVANGALLDREAAASHDITVKAASADGSFASQSFTVTVTDVDEFDVGAIADSNPAANAVAENAANGTVVGIAALAADADATNSAVTYALTDDAGGRFAIDAATGVVTVANGTLLDFESATSHVVTVRATSADGSASSAGFTIAVTDVPEGSNQAPIAGADRIITAVDHGATFSVPDWALLANDHDPEGASLALANIASYQGGGTAFDSVGLNTGTVSIDTGAGFMPPRSAGFTYQLSDGAASATGQVTVTAKDALGGTVAGTPTAEIIVDNGDGHRIMARGGDDIVFGNGGADRIDGGAGNDWLDGGAGNDLLRGGSGADHLVGGAGDDRLQGGQGADVLQGGDGADRFDFDAIADSIPGQAADVILDFVHAQGDRIDLSGIDAVVGVAGNQAFSANLLNGPDGAFTGAGQLRIVYDGATNQTIIQGNVNADLQADFEIHLVGHVELTATDFVM